MADKVNSINQSMDFKNMTNGSIQIGLNNEPIPVKDLEYQKKKAQADELHAKGYEARKKSDYQTAIDFYSKALNVLPTHFKALFNRGFAYDKLSRFDEAIQDYSKAIEIDPKNAYTYYNKGISLDRRGNYD